MKKKPTTDLESQKELIELQKQAEMEVEAFRHKNKMEEIKAVAESKRRFPSSEISQKNNYFKQKRDFTIKDPNSPATEEQVKLLRILRVEVPEECTKLEASKLIEEAKRKQNEQQFASGEEEFLL